MLDQLRFDGAAVVVTGAGTGIGQACCQALAELGAAVVMVGRTETTLRETEALIGGPGAGHACYVLDVTKEAEVAAFAEWAAARFDTVKALINNAGDNFRSAVTDLPTEDWERILAVDLHSVFYLCRAFLPMLAEAPGGGAVVNNASIFALVGNPLMPAYTAAKGGVVSLTRQLAIDYGKDGVRVNAICPGPTLSPRIRGYIEKGQTDPDRLAAGVPLGRMAECAEIANVAVFLASDAASYVNGAAVVVDGGATVQ